MLNKHTLHQYLCNIDAFLSVELGRTFNTVDITEHAVRCFLGCPPDELYVDILVSPLWATIDDFHSYLEDLSNNKRRMYYNNICNNNVIIILFLSQQVVLFCSKMAEVFLYPTTRYSM